MIIQKPYVKGVGERSHFKLFFNIVPYRSMHIVQRFFSTAFPSRQNVVSWS